MGHLKRAVREPAEVVILYRLLIDGRIGTAAPVEDIVAVSTLEPVAPTPALERILAFSTLERIVAGAAPEVIVATSPIKRVVAAVS
jgi:hypothetical protein